jgi:hypothetical protein
MLEHIPITLASQPSTPIPNTRLNRSERAALQAVTDNVLSAWVKAESVIAEDRADAEACEAIFDNQLGFAKHVIRESNGMAAGLEMGAQLLAGYVRRSQHRLDRGFGR